MVALARNVLSTRLRSNSKQTKQTGKRKRKGQSAVDKRTLLQYGAIKREIMELQAELTTLAESAITPRVGDGMPRAGGTGRPTERAALARQRLARELEDTQYALDKLRLDIEWAIEALPSEDRRLIRLRYVEELSWNRVNEELNGHKEDFIDRFDSYLRQTFRRHGIALQKMR